MKRVYQRNKSMVNKVLESQSKSEALVDLDKYFSELEHKKLDGLHYIPNASSADLNGRKIASTCFREGDGGKDEKCMTRCAALFDCLLVTFEQVRSDLEKSIVEIENTAL
ncbi:hypothetical protein AX774_g3795 [Zancudomyces culisetae]|uniref:Uncharacterized protein n=1 Tax=Zancudomyces culisetae TaxID=1213189 RepID=A0A1R1PP97_ZANCU|nr:hypothetical protein AX774_g3795 [Zancudomyces culisetae]|eukprot:OMH82723.1 hypothetical protein AX774_g3795 [Zancudomyces culisetae]